MDHVCNIKQIDLDLISTECNFEWLFCVITHQVDKYTWVFAVVLEWSSTGLHLSVEVSRSFWSSVSDPPAVPEANPSDPSSEEVNTPSKTETGLEASRPTKMDTAKKSVTPTRPDVIPKSHVTPTPRSSCSPQPKKGGYPEDYLPFILRQVQYLFFILFIIYSPLYYLFTPKDQK